MNDKFGNFQLAFYALPQSMDLSSIVVEFLQFKCSQIILLLAAFFMIYASCS